MTVHTAGPWIADTFDENERSWGVYAQGARPGSKQPAECRGKDAEANARLMAAAPDLLEALERAEYLLRRIYDGDGRALANAPSATEQARIAMAKARGD